MTAKSTRAKAKKTRKRRSKRKTANVILAILAVYLLLFSATMIFLFWEKGSVPDTLIQYTLGAGGIEAVVLAGIKISKVLTESKKNTAPQPAEAAVEHELSEVEE
jgi:flagellar basal body-associated protein FliL